VIGAWINKKDFNDDLCLYGGGGHAGAAKFRCKELPFSMANEDRTEFIRLFEETLINQRELKHKNANQSFALTNY
jgi:nanoRNase/pAp phosphatase (c-di-AMP/oligoRNAs hydrolase)